MVLLPDQLGKTYPHLLIQVGKEGTIDLVSRDNMGHFNSSGDSQIVQTLPYAIGGIWGSPAFWNNTAYFSGQYDHLKAFSLIRWRRNCPAAPPRSLRKASIILVRHRPSLPTAPATASCGPSSRTTTTAARTTLRAYDATNLGTELYNSESEPAAATIRDCQ